MLDNSIQYSMWARRGSLGQRLPVGSFSAMNTWAVNHSSTYRHSWGGESQFFFPEKQIFGQQRPECNGPPDTKPPEKKVASTRLSDRIHDGNRGKKRRSTGIGEPRIQNSQKSIIKTWNCCASESGHNNKMQPETFSINLLFFIVIFVAVVAFYMNSHWKGVRSNGSQ